MDRRSQKTVPRTDTIRVLAEVRTRSPPWFASRLINILADPNALWCSPAGTGSVCRLGADGDTITYS